MSDRRWCPACQMVIRDVNADVCNRCGGRAEQMSDDQVMAHDAIDHLKQFGSFTEDGTPVLDADQMDACRTKINKVLKKSSRWPNTAWFNDGEFDRCLATAEDLARQIKALGDFIMSKVPGEPSEPEGACACAVRIIKKLSPPTYAFLTLSGEELAKTFHEVYEELAPGLGYQTREETRKPWDEMPENAKLVAVRTCETILARFGISMTRPAAEDTGQSVTPELHRDYVEVASHQAGGTVKVPAVQHQPGSPDPEASFLEKVAVVAGVPSFGGRPPPPEVVLRRVYELVNPQEVEETDDD